MSAHLFEREYPNLHWGGGGVLVLGKLPVPGCPTVWMIVGQGPVVLAVGVRGGCLDINLFSPLSPSLWETALYRLKYCLKGQLNPKQPTNQPNLLSERKAYHKVNRRYLTFSMQGRFLFHKFNTKSSIFTSGEAMPLVGE